LQEQDTHGFAGAGVDAMCRPMQSKCDCGPCSGKMTTALHVAALNKPGWLQ